MKELSRLKNAAPSRLCHPTLLPHEKIVQSGLALTPSDIERMANQGIAVSTPAAEQFTYDNSDSWDVPLEYSRDADRNSIWELSQISKQRILNARRRDKARYT